jgi:acyl-coenzyme A synthetase/AMP-(fatty) acid ligase
MTGEGYVVPKGYREIPSELNLAAEVLDKQLDAGLGQHTALVFEGGRLTYADLGERVNRLARGLGEMGIERGDPVLLRMPNCPEFAVSFLAVVKLGGVPVLQNSLLTVSEVEYVIGDAEPVAAISLAELAGPLRALRDQLQKGLIIARGAEGDETGFEDLVEGSSGGPLVAAATKADDPAFLLYTSGTTGRPKGIVHAHRWIIALGDSNRLRVPTLPGDVALSTADWSFIAGLGQNFLFPLRNGVCCAVLEGRAFPERVLAAIEKFGVTLLYSVATVYRRILAMEGVENGYDLSSLRGCNSSGEALEKATFEEWRRRTGLDIWEHYGISEMQMVLGQGPCLPIRPGSVGVPMPGTTAEILDDNYQPVADGKIGKIGNLLIASDNPGFFLRYHKDPAKTAEVMHDGWYHTGDLAWRDADGYIWIAGRSDDCFKSRGIFISPIEIENAVRAHAAVVEACVVPIKDSDMGNRIRAVVVVREGTPTGDALVTEISDTVRRSLAPYKVPHVVDFSEALPKSAVGKVVRRALIEQPDGEAADSVQHSRISTVRIEK